MPYRTTACRECSGTGWVSRQVETVTGGYEQAYYLCERCGGRGAVRVYVYESGLLARRRRRL